MAEVMDLKELELKSRAHEIQGDPFFEDEFRPVVEMARSRFPDCHAWGQYIHNGKGYGVFITNGKRQACFQVKSTVFIDDGKGRKEVDNDIRKAGDVKKAIGQAFDAMDKSLNDGGAVG